MYVAQLVRVEEYVMSHEERVGGISVPCDYRLNIGLNYESINYLIRDQKLTPARVLRPLSLSTIACVFSPSLHLQLLHAYSMQPPPPRLMDIIMA